MGVDRSDYIVYGWKLPYKIIDDENNELEVYEMEDYYYSETVNEYTIISDGMGGSYTVFGKIILASDEWEGFNFCELNIEEQNPNDAKAKMKEVLNLTTDVEPKFLVFSHYS